MRGHPKASPGESILRFGRSRTALASAFLSLLLALIVGVSFALAAAKVPKIDETFVTNVTSTSADLGALINPRGADTTYHFEYITAAAYEANEAEGKGGFEGASRKPTEAQGDTDIGSGETDQPAAAHLSGLAPSTPYIFRVLATNSVAEAKEGPIAGPEHAFTTQEASPNLALPDDRGYEMVSPIDKNGGAISGIARNHYAGLTQAAPDGNAIIYNAGVAFADPQGDPPLSQYLASRSPASWSTHNISAPIASQAIQPGSAGAQYTAFSTDLSHGLLLNGGTIHPEPIQTPPLPGTDAPPGYENFYLRDNAIGTYQAVFTNANFTATESAAKFRLNIFGASADLSRLVLLTASALVPGAINENNTGINIYGWAAPGGGQFAQVNVLPDGQPDKPDSATGIGFGQGEGQPVSADGTRVVWRDAHNLYVRENLGQPQSPIDAEGDCEVPADACTLQLDVPQGGPDPSGGGSFRLASADGSRDFFLDPARLTSDATGGDGNGDLYQFEPEAPKGERLTDLTVDHIDPHGAEVQGVLGASEDGSYLYFVANGVLTEVPNARGEQASLGNCERGFAYLGPGSDGGTCNLYLREPDPADPGHFKTVFIATLSGVDGNAVNGSIGVANDWTSENSERTARVSPDGTHLLFMSLRPLTGYDNTVANGDFCGRAGNEGESNNPLPAACEEVFSYDAASERISCASCNPSGARPLGPSGIYTWTWNSTGNAPFYASRMLSEDGNRVFFVSKDAIVPQDTNGTVDVYEWEAQDAGTCQREGGCIGLISAGTSAEPSTFVDASADGNDVFFVTESRLVGQDIDNLQDLYDARAPHVAGEQVVFPPPPPGPAPCEGDACHSPAQAPNDPTPGTATLAGPGGNQRPVFHKHRHKAKRHHTRAANHNRGGSK